MPGEGAGQESGAAGCGERGVLRLGDLDSGLLAGCENSWRSSALPVEGRGCVKESGVENGARCMVQQESR